MTLFARAISICVLSAVAGSIFAQGSGQPAPQDGNLVTRRIKIRKADPALIMLLLAGSQSTQVPPEISTLQKLGNGGFGGSGFGGSGSGSFGSRDGSNSGRQGPSTGGGGDRGGRYGG
ncbi:MAG: hypothetical protein WAO58_06585 [Fimbriimonadaceae bacterium]